MQNRIISAIGGLACAILACSTWAGGSSYATPTSSSSTVTPVPLGDAVRVALTAGAQTGSMTVQLSQEQLTGYIKQSLEATGNSWMTDPRVLLRDGQMMWFATAHNGILAANVSMTIDVSVGADGKPEVAITQADFGPIPAPQGLNDAVSAIVQEAFTGFLGPAATGFRLEAVTISDGSLTLRGRLK